jgi:hypothetical protein
VCARLTTTFLVAALTPPVLAIATLLVARLPRDEITHPLADGAADRRTADEVVPT